MKNLMTLFAVLCFALGGFAQTAKVSGTEASLKSEIAENHIEFVFPSEVTAAKVKQSAQYYTDYFAVSFDEKSHTASIKFLKAGNVAMARRVVTRFLLSCGVRTINFVGKDYTIMEFYGDYLK